MSLSTEKKLDRAIETLTEIAKYPCDAPLFTADDSGRQVVKRCPEQSDRNGPFVGALCCMSCQAREALKDLNK